MSLEWARYPEIGLPLPDLCVFLDITPEAAAQRGGFGNEKYETSAMQMKVRELFYTLMRLPDGQNMRALDAGRGVEEVEKDIMERVNAVINALQERGSLGNIPSWNHAGVQP